MFLVVCYASAVEEKLLSNILKDYNRKARPVQKETDVVDILMDIALPQLMKVVSKKWLVQLFGSLIGLKRYRYLLNQSDAKPKPIINRRDLESPVFPPWHRLHAFASCSHWFIVLFVFLVTSQIVPINCFGFGFMTPAMVTIQFDHNNYYVFLATSLCK